MVWVRTFSTWVVVLVAVVAVTSASPKKRMRSKDVAEGWGSGGVPGRTLGQKCLYSKHCSVASSVCQKGRCVCRANYLALNETLCLPGVLLGFKCRVDAQCSMRVANSACIQGYCRCGANYVPYHRNNCLKAARVGEVCRNQAQCHLGTRYSFCNFVVPRVYGHCQCYNGHLPTDGHTCPHLRYPLGSACGTTAQCSNSVPGSLCVIQDQEPLTTPPATSPPQYAFNSISAVPGMVSRPLGLPVAVCSCPQGHHEAENGTRCIPVLKGVGVTPASLGQKCWNSDQCRASDPFSTCIAGVCHCLTDSPECSASDTGCHKDTFQCASSGRCISWYFVCNGVWDCEDGSDESTCLPNRCPSAAHTCADGTCISRAHLCDGHSHCPDGSDESSCRDRCPSTTFRCNDGQCLPGFVFCNANITCSDGSDEDPAACIQGDITATYCPFRCHNGRCRSTAILCSGTDGCGDNSDEEHCSVCSCRPT